MLIINTPDAFLIRIDPSYTKDEAHLAPDILNQLKSIAEQTQIHPSRIALFTGPSGTGKTLAASWLATRLGLSLYRVDLAAVVSKYIGETEKNLAKILDSAEEQNVILLFDEADSLFGKRTEVKDAHDRYANLDTSYLLQRIEAYPGLVILISNLRTNFDDTVVCRVTWKIEFPITDSEKRLSFWQRILAWLGIQK